MLVLFHFSTIDCGERIIKGTGKSVDSGGQVARVMLKQNNMHCSRDLIGHPTN